MKFKLDENLPGELAEILRGEGHTADTVYSEHLAGAADEAIVEAALRDGRVLLTLDKGIGNVTDYPPGSHGGVVLFRPDSAGRRSVLEFVKARLHDLLGMELLSRLTVVTTSRIRRR